MNFTEVKQGADRDVCSLSYFNKGESDMTREEKHEELKSIAFRFSKDLKERVEKAILSGHIFISDSDNEMYDSGCEYFITENFPCVNKGNGLKAYLNKDSINVRGQEVTA